MSPWGIGLRVGIEMVSALVVAVAIGWGLDRLLGDEAHPDGGVRPAGRGGWGTECLAPVRATTDTGTKGPGRGTIVAAGGSIDALSQFQLHPALGPIGASVNFTQSNLMMVVAGLLTFGLLWLGMRPRAMVPGRLQSAAEMAYEAVLGMCVETIGPEGRAYFPFIFTLFFFILFGNLLGVFPYFFTFTSHIAVTLALTVFVVGLGDGCRDPHPRLALLQLLRAAGRADRAAALAGADRGAVLPVAPDLTVGPVVRQYDGGPRDAGSVRRLRDHAGRRGHDLLVPAAFSLAVNVALIGFEILVATLQAYVFAVLTCIYLHDAVHLH